MINLKNLKNRQRRKIKYCSICGYEFKDREVVSRHFTAHHPKEDEFTCIAGCTCGLVTEFKASSMKKAKEKASKAGCACGIPYGVQNETV